SGTMARLWNVASGQMEVELAHPANLTHCVLAGDREHRLLTISAEPKARIWDLDSKQLLKDYTLGLLDERLGVRSISLTRDRGLMAMNIESNVVAVLNAESGACVAPPLRLLEEIHNFALAEDGQMLATASPSEVQLWNTRSNQPMAAPVRLTKRCWALRFS